LTSPSATPLLSIVLPAYNVQAYLRPCLDSILSQASPDIEIVAVDDCSPDASGEILDQCAAADSRVRVIHLGQNAGLGPARNAGLEQARGKYVWFVDSDDWIPGGAIASITARLRETHPDVLIFDYARAYWNHKIERNMWNYLFREPPPPKVFRLHDRPSALSTMLTAWNKAIRRDFLLDLGVRFGQGYYEDIPVTYPVLMAAGRISMLDRVCYMYRQRRSGSITRTADKRHFGVFPQYEKVFSFMDQRGPAFDEFRAPMFDRMIWHYTIILGLGNRVSPHDRRRFFRKTHEHYRRFRPNADWAMPAGLLGVRYRLIARNAYRTFMTVKAANIAQQALRRGLREAMTRGRRIAGRVRLTALHGYYRIHMHLRLDENLAVYAAYWYRGYSCNPAAIYEAARRIVPSVHGVWIVQRGAEESMPEGVDYVYPGTMRYFRVLARSKYLINNVNFPDDIMKRTGSIDLQTQHGTPLKKMGLDLQDYPVGANKMNFKKLLERCDRWDFSLSSNRFSTLILERVYPCDYESLETGYPRNDRLCNATAADVELARATLGIRPGQTTVLYAPTFRDYQRGLQPMLDLARLAHGLGPDIILLVRAHYYYNNNSLLASEGALELVESGRILDVSKHPSVQDLCLAADVLLTDYSSVMFDYAILNRPIVIYANDWETYVNCRGVYVDILKDSPGLVAATEEELVEAFRSGAIWGPEASAARARFRQRFCEFDDGMAAERVVRRVFLGEIMAPVTGAAAQVPSDGASGPSHEPGEKAGTQPMPAHSGEGSARGTKVTT
jgi:CDP-glycerol glycerophosphotransferase